MQHAPPPTQSTLLNPAEDWWLGLSSVADQSVHSILSMEHHAGRNPRSVHALYAEMECKDGHLFAVLQTRLNGLLGLERRLVGGSESDRTALEGLLRRIPRFDALLRALLRGIARGFAVVEVEWAPIGGAQYAIVDWIEHPQEYFAFDHRGALQLMVPPFRPTGRTPQQLASGREVVAPPSRKFLVLRFQEDARNPYGRGLCQHAYWYYFFKKNAMKYWAIFNERFGSPTAVARVAPSVSAEDRERLIDLFASLQGDGGVVIPESVQLELLEARQASEGRTFQGFLDWCNDEMSKIVLGGTLTASEGRRSGSLALGQVHDLVRHDYIESDARLLESVVNDQLLRWLYEVNFSTQSEQPRLLLRTESPIDQQTSIAVDRALLGLGVRLPESWFVARYGRPTPQPGEATLRYDDANFYQYHLQFGVLTVNEVRERLGLEPVPWGDQRTAMGDPTENAEARSPEDQGNPHR